MNSSLPTYDIDAVTSIEMSECNVDRSNTLTFKIILMMGVVFVTISALISVYINKVDRKKLLSMILQSFAILAKIFILAPLIFSWMAIDLFFVFCFNIRNTTFLRDGHLFYDFFELRSVRRYHQCHINHNISH